MPIMGMSFGCQSAITFRKWKQILSLQTGGSRACCGPFKLLAALEVNCELVKQNTGE